MKIKEMFDLLEKIGIVRAEVYFSGGGDDGHVEEPSLFVKPGCKLKEVLSQLEEELEKELKEDLKNLVDYHFGSGWWNGANSCGRLTVSVADRSAKVSYSVDEPVQYNAAVNMDPEYDI